MLTVALGIGVNATVFSLFDRLLFRPLPYRDPHRLVEVYSHVATGANHPVLPLAVTLALARETDLFTGIGWADGGDPVPMAPVVGENPLLWLSGVTTGTLDVLGVRPVIGSGFSAMAASPLERPVLLTFGTWRRRFGGSNDVLSKEWIARDGLQRNVRWRVVGVLPEGFLLPSPRLVTAELDGIYGVDPRLDRRLRTDAEAVAPFARLAPDVSIAMAQARVDAFVASRFPNPTNPNFRRARVVPLQSGLSRGAGPYVWMAVVGAWTVLGATCLTLAILLLTWSQSRRQDAGVRLALGASPRRLLIGALAESSLLCAAGAVIGWLGYTWTRSLFVSVIPPGLRSFAAETADARVIVATCGIALISAMVAGTLPAIRTSRTSPLNVLRPQQGSMILDRLVGGPVVLSVQAVFGVMLLVGASATVPGVLGVLRKPAGFDAADLFIVQFPTSNDETAADALEQTRRGRTALDVARRLPGVVGASLSMRDPFWSSSLEYPNVPRDKRTGFVGRVLPVDAEFFSTLGTPLLAGRAFSRAEIDEQALVAIVNEAGALGLWPDAAVHDVIGRTVATQDGLRRVVGVAADVRVGMDAGANPALFLPLGADEAYRSRRGNPYPYNGYELVLRMRHGRVPDVALLSDRLREQPWMTSNWVGARRESVAARVDLEVETPKLLALIFGTLAGIVLVLTVVAIYGLANFEIRRRREEMTVRLALGASPRALRGRLLAVTVRPVVVGVLVGLPGGWVEAKLLSTSVPVVNPGDLRTYAAAAAAILVAALVAAWLPGRRSLTMRATELLRRS